MENNKLIKLPSTPQEIASLKITCGVNFLPAGEIDGANSEYPPLSVIRKNYGNEMPIVLIFPLLAEVRSSFNVVRNLTDEQIEMISEMICRSYYYLKIPELILCFSKGVQGFYGKVFDRLDTSVIMDWINQYVIERNERIEIFNQGVESQRRLELSRMEPTPEAMEQIKKYLHPIIKSFEQKTDKEAQYQEFRRKFLEEEAAKQKTENT